MIVNPFETSPMQRIINRFTENSNKLGIRAYFILLKDIVEFAYLFTVKLLSHWRWNVAIAILVYIILGWSTFPQLLASDESSLKYQHNLRYAIKGTLIYGLGWIIVLTIHEGSHNDYMRIFKADNREGYKRLIFFNITIAIYYVVALNMPSNHYANRFLAFLLFYIWISQKYVRTAMHYNWHSITKRRMQFVNNFSMNQGTSLVFVVAPLAATAIPQLPWLPGFLTLLPILWRFTQCLIVGTHEQYLNSIKFTLNLIGFSYSVIEMPTHSHYWRIAAAIYSFYWDIFRDWKWKIRFIEKKSYRIDLPVAYFIFGLLYDLFGRAIWIFFPMTTNQRGIVEMTRRLAWNMLRIEREQVFYFAKPEKNTVKDLFSK